MLKNSLSRTANKIEKLTSLLTTTINVSSIHLPTIINSFINSVRSHRVKSATPTQYPSFHYTIDINFLPFKVQAIEKNITLGSPTHLSSIVWICHCRYLAELHQVNFFIQIKEHELKKAAYHLLFASPLLAIPLMLELIEGQRHQSLFKYTR